MKHTDIHLGYIYLINGNIERVSCIDCDDNNLFVNGVPVENVTPLPITDEIFDSFGFKYYNGWYHPLDIKDSLTFLRVMDKYVVCLGNKEIDGLVFSNVHEVQHMIHAVKGFLF